MNINNIFFNASDDWKDLKKTKPESDEDDIEEDDDGEDLTKAEIDELFDKDTHEDQIDDEDIIDD